MKNNRRYRQRDYSGLLVASVASCIFHGLLLFILSTTTIFYPMTSDREKIAFDFIWTTLGTEIDNPPQTPSLPETIATAAQVIKPDQIAVAENTDEDEFESDTTDLPSDNDALALTTAPHPPPPQPKPRAVPLKKPVIQKKTAKQANTEVNEESQKGVLHETIPPLKVAEKPARVEAPKAVDNQQKSDLENAAAKQKQAEQERITTDIENNRRLQEEKDAEVKQKVEQEQRAAELARNAELERQAITEAARKRELAENARKELLAAEKAKLAAAKQEQAERERIAAEIEKKRRLQKEQAEAVRQRAEQEKRTAELARKAELEQQARAEAIRKREVAENARKEKLAEEKARLERLNKMKREEEQRAREKLARERLAAERIAAAKLEQERNALKSTLNTLNSVKESGVNQLSTGKSAPGSAAMTNRPSEPVMVKSVATEGKQVPLKESKPEGITLPPIKGDIKVIVQSEGDVIVKISFIDYPRTKHNKPITKNEARTLKKLTPIIVRSTNHTIEAVIEHATDGIYVVLVEPKDDKPIDGSFSLKLLDSAIKSIGKRKVAGQTEVARILMPEGVLWSDDSAFSGNFEDSESITKFNSDTGLIWKEYRK